ncbi:MAG: hypothetical protein KatS3mg032_2318 [Cyclobacteriaceae bacterium]|nr:MAG: hypothetical protein KatS3mg032_2318 [Cyclobacteriaceae bacterium]
MRNETPQYEYADGNANRYILTAYYLEYFPVTPQESSSGIYHGGKPFKVRLTPAEYKSLQLLFEKALVDTACHIPSRTMMSGLIIKHHAARTERVIIAPAASIRQEIEAALQPFHPKQ